MLISKIKLNSLADSDPLYVIPIFYAIFAFGSVKVKI
jgi:hypothetical protein